MWYVRRPIRRLGTFGVLGIGFGEATVVGMRTLLLGLDFLDPQLGNESACHLLDSFESFDDPSLSLGCVSDLELYHLTDTILHSLHTSSFGATFYAV